MAVILIDPNKINTPFENGIPQYQDMYIFAELTAKTKGRTTIINGNVSSTNSNIINLLGVNQNNSQDNPNYLNFTTNYYDESTGNNTQYEGFGITSIHVKTNASFVPQVNIQFVDVRGLSFFNQENSPYRILFDFPPPTFTLTVKGHYGKALTYELHLVKYTTEFNPDSGNFIIDAQFVAMTFAPLSDTLFRYIVNFPLIADSNNSSNTSVSANPDGTTKPKNTNDLILKLKNLYSGIQNKIKTDADTKNYNNNFTTIDNINLSIQMLNQYAEYEPLKKYTPYLVIKRNIQKNLITTESSQSNDNCIIERIIDVSGYDKEIYNNSNSGLPNSKDLTNRLCIVFISKSNVPSDDSDLQPKYPSVPYAESGDRIDDMKNVLSEYANMLINNTSVSGIDKNTINSPTTFFSKYYIDGNEIRTEYASLDITNYYIKLYKDRENTIKENNELATNIVTKVNNMVMERLGMTPTIYNIFEIILNDVDTFYRKMSETSKIAMDKHKSQIDLIVSSNDSNDIKDRKEVYPYPLIINKKKIVGGDVQEKASPIELRNKGIEFPELTLVENFINTFQKQRDLERQNSLRSGLNDDGSYIWIPISPIDSILNQTSVETPYINDDVGAVTVEIYKTLLNRFYMISQGIIVDKFYVNEQSTSNTAYVNLYAEAEAVNLISSISDKNLSLLKTECEKYRTADLQNFYDYLNANVSDVYNFNGENIPITPTRPSDGNIYVNKNNENFKGFSIYDDGISIKVEKNTSDSKNPVDKFAPSAEERWWKANPIESTLKFSNENVIFISDIQTPENAWDGTYLGTRYLCSNQFRFINPEGDDKIIGISRKQIDFYNNGNSIFDGEYGLNKNNIKNETNIVTIWSNQLGKYGDRMYDSIININSLTYDKDISSMFILSNFGYTLSPFNKYPNNLNAFIFNTPAAIEIPKFLSAYIGSLINIVNKGLVQKTVSFFTGMTTGNGFCDNLGYFILADLHDVQEFLSKIDKDTFYQQYRLYMSDDGYDGYDSTIKSLNDLHDDVNKYYNEGIYNTKEIGYEYLLNPKSDNNFTTGPNRGYYYKYIIEGLITKNNILNFSENTFKMKDITTFPINYTSLAEIISNGYLGVPSKQTKQISNQFFKTFFSKLDSEIKDKKEENKKKIEEETRLKGDVDVITQTYYSFKNINDRWLVGDTITGYPFNGNKSRLIDNFAFVDRAMNPIGDTVINAEVLTTLLDDPNVSVFSVLSQLLSANGFEFFPLQNFMSFQNNDWEESFKIQPNININKQASFVCMYIGGSSSYPSVAKNGFENDGVNFDKKETPDFDTNLAVSEYTNEMNSNKDFPWQQVRAFRVRFGQQNQSIFTNIKIDSKEYSDTNESIQILSRLAGDNKEQAPVPKGQNLYNIYENRSYKATISGFGNMMIQPTQYFQLENIPLFDGAYIILDVEHRIDGNKMTTTFSGTKIAKYPIPRITNPIAFTGFDNEFNSMMSAGSFVQQVLLSSENMTKFNSMYTLKIE